MKNENSRNIPIFLRLCQRKKDCFFVNLSIGVGGVSEKESRQMSVMLKNLGMNDIISDFLYIKL